MTDAPVIETERLRLRRPETRDLAAIEAFAATPRARFIRGDDYFDGVGWRILALHLGHWSLRGYGSWIVTEKAADAAIGLVGAWFPGDWPEPEIGWSVFEGWEGRGVAAEAARAARDRLYTRFGWTTAVSYVAAENARSRQLAERLGCVVDAEAAGPAHRDPCIVYRHPAPEAAS